MNKIQSRNSEKENTFALFKSDVGSHDYNSLSYRIEQFKNIYNPLNDWQEKRMPQNQNQNQNINININNNQNNELRKKNRKLASKSVNNHFIFKENNSLAESSNYQIPLKQACDLQNYFYLYKRSCGKRIFTLPKLSKTMKFSDLTNFDSENQQNITLIPLVKVNKDEIIPFQNKETMNNLDLDQNSKCKMENAINSINTINAINAINTIRVNSPKINSTITSIRNCQNSKKTFLKKKFDRNRMPSCLKSVGIPAFNKQKNLNIEMLDNLINECKKNETENESRIIEYTRRKEEVNKQKFDQTFRIIRDTETNDIHILKDLVNYQNKLHKEESQEFLKLQNTLKEIYDDPNRLAAKLEKNKTFTSKYRAKIYNLKRNKTKIV